MTVWTVRAHARLACCLLDMTGDRGRVDGTLGIGLQEPFVEVVAAPHDRLEFDADHDVADAIRAGVGLAERIARGPMRVKLSLLSWIRPHVGLGHKTQTVLAAAAAALSASQVPYSMRGLVRESGRGGTSGAGVHTFLGGGVVLDGGHRFGSGGKTTFGPSSRMLDVGPPPLIARVEPPDELRVVIASPIGIEGASGDDEAQFFAQHFPLGRADTDALIADVVMRLIPAIIEGDYVQIGAGIDAIQLSTFKRGIWAAQAAPILFARERLRRAGVSVGLSSMGSTMYSIVGATDAATVVGLYRDELTRLGVDAVVHATSVSQRGACVSSSASGPLE
ncbi:beta-ribofuranosylaminobenzene 5'-phosphate synthase family protein [Microbacterium sp.]|uniref:beta-ribofuranosylaminobenzene 5'-phosphate synthase family protein n=1 Tax=Microbacterium sp. TaxID=51671 RepID=UPI003C7658BC